MAWIDDRIWCHPKLVDITPQAFRAYINGLAYSSGFDCKGHLTVGQQALIGATPRLRSELVSAGLWELNGDGASVVIHDYEEHNGEREARRERERERKRQARKEGRWK